MAQFDALGDVERDLWVADWEAEQQTCADCGKPVRDCSDPERLWYPYRRICYATREVEAAQGAYEALHKKQPWHDGTYQSWSRDRSAAHPYHFSHGVRIGVAAEDLTPWDPFTTRVDASPVVAEQVPEESGDAHCDGGEGDEPEQ